MSLQKRSVFGTLEDTSIIESHSQRLFKNVANLALRGNTFDARHLDNFLDSVYGDRALNVHSRKFSNKT